jgi:hypothetical protein
MKNKNCYTLILFFLFFIDSVIFLCFLWFFFLFVFINSLISESFIKIFHLINSHYVNLSSKLFKFLILFSFNQYFNFETVCLLIVYFYHLKKILNSNFEEK